MFCEQTRLEAQVQAKRVPVQGMLAADGAGGRAVASMRGGGGGQGLRHGWAT